MWSRSIAAVVVIALLSVSAHRPSLPPDIQSIPTTPAHGSAHDDHDCCPGLHSKIELMFVSLAPASMPCGGESPCCARPAPENPPSLPAASRPTPPRADATLAIAAHDTPPAHKLARERSRRADYDFYSLRNTVLRI